ncbi:hypothetical protein RSOLAG1IB_12291 [Rhizoctonia solani AG-1 IB]|uniref:Uncharacterized protein n=1 Tax=Thanatephorus cucumeris (strain AG1-IB / isolate 7/3/14) TaxID=1108050 RepID=A0A0B7FQ09_THACB|nr:hypothetical protein RSOLAG1IB_12291 [Rhizoctonia solani AG-1 IB]
MRMDGRWTHTADDWSGCHPTYARTYHSRRRRSQFPVKDTTASELKDGRWGTSGWIVIKLSMMYSPRFIYTSGSPCTTFRRRRSCEIKKNTRKDTKHHSMHQPNAHLAVIGQTQPRTSHTSWKANASRRVSSRLGSQKKAWL